jgi:hypothetical protein
MSTKILFSLPVVAASMLFTACSGNEDPVKDQPKVEIDIDESAISDDQDFILPQPTTLANAFKNAGLTYRPGKANPASNKDNYSKKTDQLLNLGVYTTDLAYCAINNKTQEARQYLSAIQALGSKVGLESVYTDKTLIEKFDKNMNNQSALEDLIYEMQDRSDAFLQDNDLRYLAAVQFAGAWAEGMYLGIEDSRKKQDLITVAVVDQMTLLRNTIRGLERHPAPDARLKEVTALFRNVLSTYENFASVKKATKNVNFEAPELTAEEFEALAAKIVSLRNGITAPAQK